MHWMTLCQNYLVFYKGKAEPGPDTYHTKIFSLLTEVDNLGVRSPLIFMSEPNSRRDLQPNPKGDPGFVFDQVKKKAGKEPKSAFARQFSAELTTDAVMPSIGKPILVTLGNAQQQQEWLDRIQKQIAFLRPMWHDIQEAGADKVIEDMLAALPRNGAPPQTLLSSQSLMASRRKCRRGRLSGQVRGLLQADADQVQQLPQVPAAGPQDEALHRCDTDLQTPGLRPVR